MRTRLQRVASFLLCLLLAACANQQKLAPAQIAAGITPVSQATTIALLGGTGMVGGHILHRAMAQGYPLRVLSRSPEKLAYLGDRITIVAGDARDPEVIKKLLMGSDVVISALGPGVDAPGDLTTSVSRNVVAAMRDQGIARYLVVSGAGVVTPHDRRNLTGWTIRQLARLRYPSLLRDRQNEYAFLSGTGLDWTVVRCPLIESRVSEKPAQSSLHSPESFRLEAGELAEFLLQQIAAPTYFQRAPFAYSGAP